MLSEKCAEPGACERPGERARCRRPWCRRGSACGARSKIYGAYSSPLTFVAYSAILDDSSTTPFTTAQRHDPITAPATAQGLRHDPLRTPATVQGQRHDSVSAPATAQSLLCFLCCNAADESSCGEVGNGEASTALARRAPLLQPRHVRL